MSHFGDGTINVFELATGTFLPAFTHANETPNASLPVCIDKAGRNHHCPGADIST